MPKIGGTSASVEKRQQDLTHRGRFESEFHYLESKEEIAEFADHKSEFMDRQLTGIVAREHALRPKRFDHLYEPVSKVEMAPVTLQPVQDEKMGHKAKHKQKRALKKSKKAMGTHSAKDSEYTDLILESHKKAAEEPAVYPSDQLAARKKEFLGKKWNPDMFKKDYFGRNFAAITREMEEYKAFLMEFLAGGPQYDSLTDSEKARIPICKEIYDMMSDCYEKALHVHGIKTHAVGVIGVLPEGESANADKDLSDAMEATKKRVEGSNQEFKERLVESVNARYEQAMSDMRESAGYKAQKAAIREKFPTIQADLASYDYAEGIDKILSSLDAQPNATNVALNKEHIDSILRDFIHVTQVLDGYTEQMNGWRTLFDKIYDSGDKQVNIDDFELYYEDRLIQSEMAKLANKVILFQKTQNQLTNVLRFLIEGNKEAIGDAEMIVLKRYGYKPAEEKVEAGQNYLTLYVDTYNERMDLYKAALARKYPDSSEKQMRITDLGKNRVFELMKPGDEAYNDRVIELFDVMVELKDFEKMAKEGKPLTMTQKTLLATDKEIFQQLADEILIPKFREITDLCFSDSQGQTPEELVSALPKLIVSMPGMMISDLLKDSPSDIPGLSLKEKFLGKPPITLKDSNPKEYEEALERYQARDVALRSKLTITEGLLRQARAASILSLGSIDAVEDPLSLLTRTEAIKRADASKTPWDIVMQVAKEEMEKGKKTQQSGEQMLMSSQEIFDWFYNEPGRRLAGSKFSFIVFDEKTGGNAMLARAASYVKNRKRMMMGLGAKESDFDGSDFSLMKQLYGEAMQNGNQSAMLDLAVMAKLSFNNFYQIAGVEGVAAKEAIFRAFGTIAEVASFKSMSEDEFRKFVGDLSAGAFLDEKSSQEEIEDAKQKNVSALRTYYDKMQEHYDYLGAKYGYQLPDTAYIILHYPEMKADLACAQVNDSLAKADKTVLKDDNPEDVRFKKQAAFFCHLSGVITGVSDMYVMLKGEGEIKQLAVENPIMQEKIEAIATLGKELRSTGREA